MKDRTLGRINSRTGQLGRICPILSVGRITRASNSIPHVRPRVSSSTNGNQCVSQLKPLLLAGSPTRKTMNTFSNVKLDVHSVHTAPGHPQKNEISPGAAGCYFKKSKLKSVKSVSCVTPFVLCKSCHKCSQCCHKSSCRGQTPKLLEKMVRSGCRTESGSNPERGLHPPLSDPAELIKNSHSHKLLWQSSQKSQTVGGITSAYGKKCHRTSSQTGLTRVLQPTIFSPKAQQQVVAKPTRKDTGTYLPTGLLGKGVHVLDRPVNSHRKASSPGQTTHEAHRMTSQKQLEDTGIVRKTASPTQISTSSLTMVAKGRQCPHRPTITPHTTCCANLYRRIKRRVGRSLKRVHC